MDDDLERARQCCRRQAWDTAYASFSLADRASPLEADDLEAFAMSAYLVDREDQHARLLERAYAARVAAADDLRAARCAFWSGLTALLRGESGHATAWFSRAERLVANRDCVESGYLLVPAAERHLAEGKPDSAYETAGAAAASGERFADSDLVAIARHIQGRARIGQGQVRDGLALLDEAMLSVTRGELTPIVTGLVYCSVIDTCQQAYALDRAREWTAALAEWCDNQAGMLAFTRSCLAHRAEVFRLQGAWPEAIEEVRRACDSPTSRRQAGALADALYQKGEVHRLRGEYTEAETAYRDAADGGRDPQPGLALLWLARGRAAAAEAAIRRTLAAQGGRLARAKLLPARIEIAIAVDDPVEARAGSRELDEIALSLETDALDALAAQARGAVALADGDPEAALKPLYRARDLWQLIEVPYRLARTRELIGLACRSLGDEAGAEMELDAARTAFARLGAGPDRNRVEKLLRATAPPACGLTPRELQVLQALATGKTNRAIAAELAVSERTVDRHVGNIFAKLDVSTRAAATACAYERGLVRS